MIIGINGYAGSGKDTVGKIIQYLRCTNVGEVSLEDIVNDKKGHHNWWLEEQSGWEIKKFAGKLKQIASILIGIPVEWFENQEFKKTRLGPEWCKTFGHIPQTECMTVREFLQKLGTDALRDGLHTNTWVNALMADYRCAPADRAPGGWDCDNWIVTDTRFPNEAKAIKDNGGIIIRVNRPGVTAVNAHPSETGLDDWNFDAIIENDGTPEDLAWKVRDFLHKHKL